MLRLRSVGATVWMVWGEQVSFLRPLSQVSDIRQCDASGLHAGEVVQLASVPLASERSRVPFPSAPPFFAFVFFFGLLPFLTVLLFSFCCWLLVCAASWHWVFSTHTIMQTHVLLTQSYILNEFLYCWASILVCCSELWAEFLFSKYPLLCFLEHEARSSTIDKHVWGEDLCVQLSGHLQASQDISSGQKKESLW